MFKGRKGYAIFLSVSLLLIFSDVKKVQNRSLNEPLIYKNPIIEDLTKSMDTFVDKKKSSKDFPPGVAVCIVRNGALIMEDAYGVKKVDSADSVDVHTVFRLASLSKTFASFLSAMLVEEQYFGWDDPVVDYLPEFRLKNTSSTDQLTIRHVLSQTTGLPRHAYTNFVEEGMSNEDMIRALGEVEVIARPGEFYSYQNVAYSLIESIARAATGASYTALLTEKVLNPLGMNDASVNFHDLIVNDNHATPHVGSAKGWRTTRINDTYYNVASAGGVNASISDMSAYLMALTSPGEGLIEASSIEELFKPHVKTNIRWKYFSRWPEVRKTHYGLGWRVLNYGEDIVVYHGGYVNGFKSSIAIIPDQNTGICVLTNGSSRFPDDYVHFFIREYMNQTDAIEFWDERTVVVDNKESSKRENN